MAAPEDWPPYHIGSRDHMHAIGVLIAAWNMVEGSYQAFIQLVFPHNLKAAISTYELMNNDSRIKLIRSELFGTLNQKENELLEYFFKSANICMANRNVIAHSHYSNQAPGDHLLLSKGRSKDQQSVNIFTFSITGIREMADATYLTAFFGMNLWSAINIRISNEYWASVGVPPKFSFPLPEKPPLPRSWDQIREAPKPPQPPPQSSEV
jgi:hypothetical protein